MEYSFGTSLVVMFGTVPAALAMVWITLRGADKSSGQDFKKNMQKISDDPRALAHYYGLRGIGVCILVGLLLSKFV